jgi:hypothetical protein
VSIDSNADVARDAEAQLARSRIPFTRVLTHDLAEGLPDALFEILRKSRPERVRYISSWGISYLDLDALTRLLRQCLDAGGHGGAPRTVDLNMITEGRFDPEVLRRHFIRDIVPVLLLRGQVRSLVRALRALPEMRRFGETFQQVVPIWQPDELRTQLEERGFRFVRADHTLLWGQSTALRIGQ